MAGKKNLLNKYNEKRDFKKTAEPEGKLHKSKTGFSYLIQKHAATRLHYDFRLELDDVLKSWAVTKGPSLDPQDRRLAVEVEDHPVQYGSFEGIIPKGEYGGGTVMLWDQGTWEPIDDPHEGLKKGHLHFRLHGKRLQGEWALVRMKPRPQDKGRNNWLLLKKGDEFAKAGDKDKLLLKNDTSITTKRSMDEIAGGKSKVWHSNRDQDEKPVKKKPVAKPKAVKGKKLPDFIEPQLATLSSEMPTGSKWVHEIKFDGYRTLARIENGKATMLTRTGLNWTHKFGSIAKAFKKLPVTNAIIDGEIIALDEEGKSNFTELQKALTDGRDEDFQYYAFDLLFLDGEDYTKKPLLERKEKLEELIKNGGLNGIFYSDHFSEEKGFYKKACELGLEGVISKRADDIYHKGRGKSWLKSKCHKRQEFVIGGYTLPSNGMAGIGALLVGYYEDGKLVYASKCGTGFDSETSRLMRKKLEALKTKENPFVKVTPIGRRNAIWVKPKLVCEIEFTEWTGDGALRHPSFQGLREDKPATQVGRDYALPAATVSKKPAKAATKVKSKDVAEVAGIRISHPDRLVFEKEGVSKLDVVNYYNEVSDHLLPYINDRLISTIRCPDNIKGQCFFQRHAGTSGSKYLKAIKVKGHGDDEPYMALDNKNALLSMTQMGIIEIHPWGSHIKDVDKPDRLVFDFDPDEKLPWKEVVSATFELKKKLEKLGLKTFVKTTGGKGLHVCISFKPKYSWDVMKPWAKAVAESMVRESPGKYTANMSKAGRKGKIFIDYLRNGLTSTAVAAYSLRARDGATVSMPIDWKELTPKLDPKKFNINTVPQILKKRKSDPWKDFYKPTKTFTAAMLKEYNIKPE